MMLIKALGKVGCKYPILLQKLTPRFLGSLHCKPNLGAGEVRPLQVAIRNSLLKRVHRLHPVLPARSHFELPSHGLSLSVPDRVVTASSVAGARLDKVLAVEPGE